MNGFIYNLTFKTEDCSIDGRVPFELTRQDVIEKYGEPNEINEKFGNYHSGTTNNDSTP